MSRRMSPARIEREAAMARRLQEQGYGDAVAPKDKTEGTVMPRVEIEVRQEPVAGMLRGKDGAGIGRDRRGRPIAGFAGGEDERAWRVYPRGESTPLTERGVLLGGRLDDACAAAERVAKENGFHFVWPPALWLPTS